ncbi:ABC transporter ATP-binding protein [Hyphomicrobium facile]|uniref:ATP-binding cassette, subfamily B n=1 Tax=Hyphomicrobium facile TaxID=51670 RepID=A0A1I7NDD6_9HYPH|nr:ABC transporter ATP-binding protein [Hyphomicrobium facile]SFV32672.1 ATP-binding cassette, subfamily B [Hyphomicrobium facile]
MPTTFDLLKRLMKENGREYAPQYALVVVCMLLVAAMTSLSAYVLKYVIDTIFVHQNRTALVGITFGIVGIFVAKGFAAYFSEVVLGTIGNRLVAQTQKRMFEHMMKVDVAFFQRHSSSELVTRMSHNANAVRDMLNMVSLNLGRDLFTIIGLVITMIALDPILSAIALIGGPVAALSSRKMVERIKKATRSEVHSLSGIVQITREVSQGAQVVKSFQLENKMRVRMFDAIEAVQRLSNKMLRIGAGVNPLMETIGGCAVAAVVFYAGWRNLYHGDSPGQFFAFITALLMCADPARRLSRVQLSLATAAVGVRMMYELMDSPAREDEPPGRPELVIRNGEIVLRDVSFRYVPNKPVINGMSFSVPAGKVTALVGHSGGGKSTVFALLQRLREPDSGVIEIDGQAIADVSLKSLRHNISVVGQDAFLFEGSIIDNIRAGLDNATDEQCIEAAKAASAHEFIMSLPRGYENPVGELGAQVSGGQRQRIALARAYLKSAPIILLDEPTSALDSETEDAIQRELRNLTKGKTTLVIAHRLSTILHADLIHVIEAGRVIESGSHDELIANGGAYNRLFKLQFAKYLENKQPLAEAV